MTFPFETRQQINAMHISPNGKFVLAIEKRIVPNDLSFSVDGKAVFANYASGQILSRMNFKHPVSVVKFSPDSR